MVEIIIAVHGVIDCVITVFAVNQKIQNHKLLDTEEPLVTMFYVLFQMLHEEYTDSRDLINITIVK